MNEQFLTEKEPRRIEVSAGTLYLDHNSMTYVVLDPAVGFSRRPTKQLRVTRWMLDNMTSEYYWLYDLQELVNPRTVQEVLYTLDKNVFRRAGRKGAELGGVTLSALVEQEITEALHKGVVIHEIR